MLALISDTADLDNPSLEEHRSHVWPFTDRKPTRRVTRPDSLERRVALLEERFDWLYHDLNKLRGRVTGADRLTGDRRPEQLELEDEIELSDEELELIRRHRLKEA